jgi:hypothetical protein
MKYSNFIDVNEGFQTSVNLEYDLNRKEKVKSYIPTEQSVKVLGTFLRSFYYNNESQNRATVLIGPYGRGKSHLLLVLTALTSMDMFELDDCDATEAKTIQYELCKKIEIINNDFIENPIVFENNKISGSFSYGISTFPEDGIDYNSLFKKADRNMYDYKQKNK